MLRLPAPYIGETGRNLSLRLTEQKRATRNGDVSNHIAEHRLQTTRQIDWDSAGAPNENIVQNHLNIALLNVF